jgi:diketogulonate reductase-like aldo/keto reductase
MAESLPPLRRVTFPDGASVPALGQGTWTMGERHAHAAKETQALALGIELGMTLVDTAEMYGDGGAEKIVARAIEGRRREVFVVGKVYPHNAGRKSAISACERSLSRLRVEQLDLYLLHWRGRIPLAETVDAFERLIAAGKIARWGVSNFDVADLRELFALPEGRRCATNQVLYHLGERGTEWELQPWMRTHRLPLMAYSPLGKGALLRSRALAAIAKRIETTPAAVALAWLLRQPGVIVIPESANARHVRANRAAAELVLEPSTLEHLEGAFPAPRGPTALAVI